MLNLAPAATAFCAPYRLGYGCAYSKLYRINNYENSSLISALQQLTPAPPSARLDPYVGRYL